MFDGKLGEQKLKRRLLKQKHQTRRVMSMEKKESRLYGCAKTKVERWIGKQYFKADRMREDLNKLLENIWKKENISAMDKYVEHKKWSNKVYVQILNLRSQPNALWGELLNRVSQESKSIAEKNFKEQAQWYEMLAATFRANPTALKLLDHTDSSYYTLEFESEYPYEEKLEVPTEDIIQAWVKTGMPKVIIKAKTLSLSYLEFLEFIKFIRQTGSILECSVCNVDMDWIPFDSDKFEWKAWWRIDTLKLYNVDDVHFSTNLSCSFWPNTISFVKAPIWD